MDDGIWRAGTMADGWPSRAGDDLRVPPPSPSLPFPEVVRSLVRFLAAAMGGVAAMLVGLAWDAVRHARDPGAVHDEATLFSVSNPAHALLLAGGALAVAGLTAATVRALALSGGRRLSSPRTAVALVAAVVVMAAGTAGAVRWASTAQPPLATGPLAPFSGPDVHGIDVVNSHSDAPCRPTKAEKAAAAKLVNDTEVATAKYRSFETALADGYVGPANPTATEHYSKLAHVGDKRILDPTRPESLMYTPTARGMVLVGVMYLTDVPGELGPEPGGCLTRWHVHTNACWSTSTFQLATILQKPGEDCPPGEFRLVPPPALHVWFIDVPGGRFAAEVDPEYLRKAVGP